MSSNHNSNSVQALVLEALAASAHGNHAGAARLLEEACAILGDEPVFWYNLGIEYLALDRAEDALGAFSKAESLGDTSCELLSNTGLAWFKAGNAAEAERQYERALSANPCSPEALNNMGVLCFLRGQYQEARGFFEQAVTYNPSYTDALINLRDTYEELGYDNLKASIESKLQDTD